MCPDPNQPAPADIDLGNTFHARTQAIRIIGQSALDAKRIMSVLGLRDGRYFIDRECERLIGQRIGDE
jgi:hypothetical protein